jgi:hypothetical protein
MSGKPVPIELRFWTKVDATGICWEWTAAKSKAGYGVIGLFHQKVGLAHRVAWELLVGPIPEGLELDHLCRNRSCVNPDHLEPVSHLTNARRGVRRFMPYELAAIKAARTECPRGHEFSTENTYTTKKGARVCRTCARNYQRKRRSSLIA